LFFDGLDSLDCQLVRERLLGLYDELCPVLSADQLNFVVRYCSSIWLSLNLVAVRVAMFLLLKLVKTNPQLEALQELRSFGFQ